MDQTAYVPYDQRVSLSPIEQHIFDWDLPITASPIEDNLHYFARENEINHLLEIVFFYGTRYHTAKHTGYAQYNPEKDEWNVFRTYNNASVQLLRCRIAYDSKTNNWVLDRQFFYEEKQPDNKHLTETTYHTAEKEAAKHIIAQTAALMKQKEITRALEWGFPLQKTTENSIAYYASVSEQNNNYPFVVVFFTETENEAPNYDSARKKGKAIWNPEESLWRLCLINGKSKLRSTDKVTKTQRIKVIPSDTQWRAVAIERDIKKIPRDKIEKSLTAPVVDTEQELFSAPPEQFRKDLREEIKKRMYTMMTKK